jgi:endoglucanase
MKNGPRQLTAAALAGFVGLFWCLWLGLAPAPAADESSPPKSTDPFEQNKRLGRGVNVLGYDPLWRGKSKGRFRAEHFALIHEAGFNHVRINLAPFRDADSKQTTTISDNYLRTLDWAVEQALANKLMVILDFHEFEEMARDPEGNKERFLGMWRQIAEHCKNAPPEVLFEILNEPNKKLTPELWNQYLREALAVIRESNPTRTVIVGPGEWNAIKQLEKLELPDDDRNLIVTLHYYSPFAFTHQGAGWTDRKDKVGVSWNGTEKEQEAIVRDFEKAQVWAESHHRPLYLGEFGALEKGEMASRLRWTSFVARQAEKLGWSWGYWQFEGNFIVFDMANNRWVEPIRDALIPPSP